MKIDKPLVESIAELAQLALPGEELNLQIDSLQNILDLADQMAAVDTQDVEPMANPLDAVQRLRADTVTESDQRDHFQTHAPATKDGLYLVPRVVE
jgi:aspartyl-tRNA(Asn)/glutamyl-tRNA(Gln) amidotransferase subunit C